jgi:DNA-binding beta-propeller fold protein YncE
MKKSSIRFRSLLSVALFLLPTLGFAGKLRQVAILDLPGRPGFESAVFANGRLVITHQGADTVDIFDPVKRRLIAQVNGVLSPRGVAVDDAAGLVYIASAGARSIVVINSNNWRVEGMIGLKYIPENVLLIPNANELLVTNPRDHSVSLVPTGALGQKSAERTIVDVLGKPAGVSWDSQRKIAYLALEDRSEIISINPSEAGRSQDNKAATISNQSVASGVVSSQPSLSVAEASSPAIGKRIKLAASLPTAIVYEPSSQRIFVAVRYAVLAIDAETGAEQARVAAPGGTNALWLDAPSNTLYASAEDGSINIINVRANGLLSQTEYHGEIRGHTMAYDSAKKVMFLSGGRDGRSKLVILKEMDPIALPPSSETALKQ